jgi:GGDEF domain-containing protein
MLVSLENLDLFREAYGFVASDDVLRAVSLMVQNSARKVGNPGDFVGHFSTSDFVVVTTTTAVTELGARIRSRLEQSLDYFYPLRDRESPKDPDKRLKVRMADLLPEQGPFSDLDELKTTLLRMRT